MQQLYPIKGVVQNYAWGGTLFIPELLGVVNLTKEKYAELWIGTHSNGTAILENDEDNRSLLDLINSNPVNFLGGKTVVEFGTELPFLLKVLDVRKMLSIQTHPTKAAAEIGFEKENKAGIPLTANHRNYKDNNHKPEVMVALSDFWLLHGFKSQDKIEHVLQETPEFQPLQKYFQGNNIFALYQHVMQLPQLEVNKLLAPLQKRLMPIFENHGFTPNQADYWAAQAFNDYTKDGHFDRGIFSIYFFNLVYLKTGQGIYQDAGVPHAYLRGVNVELMANSDNVFRGGLTSKYIDVPELLQNLLFEPVEAQIIEGKTTADFEKVYLSSPDFELSNIVLESGRYYQKNQTNGPEIWIVLDGEVKVYNSQESLFREKGALFFIKDGGQYQIFALKKANLFKASIPQ